MEATWTLAMTLNITSNPIPVTFSALRDFDAIMPILICKGKRNFLPRATREFPASAISLLQTMD
jgi:hypothetical protein